MQIDILALNGRKMAGQLIFQRIQEIFYSVDGGRTGIAPLAALSGSRPLVTR